MTNYNSLLLEKPLEYNMSTSFFEDAENFKLVLTKFNADFLLKNNSNTDFANFGVYDAYTGDNAGGLVYNLLGDFYSYDGLGRSELELVHFFPAVIRISDFGDGKVSKIFKSLFETAGNSVNSLEFDIVRLLFSSMLSTTFFLTSNELIFLFNLLRYLHLDFINAYSEFGNFFTHSGKFLPFGLLESDNYDSDNFYLSLLNKKNKFSTSDLNESNKTLAFFAFGLLQSNKNINDFSILLRLDSLR